MYSLCHRIALFRNSKHASHSIYDVRTAAVSSSLVVHAHRSTPVRHRLPSRNTHAPGLCPQPAPVRPAVGNYLLPSAVYATGLLPYIWKCKRSFPRNRNEGAGCTRQEGAGYITSIRNMGEPNLGTYSCRVGMSPEPQRPPCTSVGVNIFVALV